MRLHEQATLDKYGELDAYYKRALFKVALELLDTESLAQIYNKAAVMKATMDDTISASDDELLVAGEVLERTERDCTRGE